MELDTSAWMLIFFVVFLILSIWKIWAFLPSKQLADDDTTEEATQELHELMLKVIVEKAGALNEEELFKAIKEDERFNSELFWRFNLNKLKQLLNAHYLNNPQMQTIEDIYKELKS